MNIQTLDLILVVVLLLNFYILATTQLRAVVYAVAAQGIMLAVVYLLSHQTGQPAATVERGDALGRPTSLRPADLPDVGRPANDDFDGRRQHAPETGHKARIWLLAAVMALIKGFVIPQLLLRALREADVRRHVESSIGIVPTLLTGAAGTGLAMVFATTLPLNVEHGGNLVVPASLATVLTGFLILTTRWRALTQVLGYIVLENGIFIFGLLLVEAIPILVELGVLLDLFVGVFVMGIIINHVSRAFGTASAAHLQALRE